MSELGAYDLSVVAGSAAVGGGERGRTRLGVPGHVAVLGGAADRQRVDAVRVAVAVAVVAVLAAVARRPHEDRTETAATLPYRNARQTTPVLLAAIKHCFVAGATALRDPWDASTPTLEIVGTIVVPLNVCVLRDVWMFIP